MSTEYRPPTPTVKGYVRRKKQKSKKRRLGGRKKNENLCLTEAGRNEPKTTSEAGHHSKEKNQIKKRENSKFITLAL